MSEAIRIKFRHFSSKTLISYYCTQIVRVHYTCNHSNYSTTKYNNKIFVEICFENR